MDINNQQFLALLRSALHHFYEPDELRRSPLAALFGIADRVDAAAALQEILQDAITAIRPKDDESPQSNAWVIHDILFFRYVRGYTREAVASQLGISDRQLSREQRTALETLALGLWKTYHLDGSQVLIAEPESTWAESLPPEKPSTWKPVLLSVLDLLLPLTREHETAVAYELDESVPDVLVPQMVLRHALLNILGCLIPAAKHTALDLLPSVSDQTLTIICQVSPQGGVDQALLDGLAFDQNIEVARQFVESAGGKLELLVDENSLKVSFYIPALKLIPVLVIDDNADTIQLFQRYAQGSRYAVAGVQEASEAFRMIEKVQPRVILMDVMMPELDGWDLLTSLRQDSQLSGRAGGHIAILMCSILPQASLARSLGADGFLQKPVLPQDFLRALDAQMDQATQT